MPISPARLATLSHHAERTASRRLAARSGCTYDDALLSTMRGVAGGDTRLEHLLEQRAAEQASQLAKAADRQARRDAALTQRQLLKNGAPTPWRGWFDGSAWPNPGRCGIGALLTGPDGERIAVSRAAGYGNSSEAEYRALITLLETALEHGADGLTVYGDSKVVIDDVLGTGAAPAAALSDLRAGARALLARFKDITLRWIPRHRNADADALSQQARASMPATEA